MFDAGPTGTGSVRGSGDPLEPWGAPPERGASPATGSTAWGWALGRVGAVVVARVAGVDGRIPPPLAPQPTAARADRAIATRCLIRETVNGTRATEDAARRRQVSVYN